MGEGKTMLLLQEVLQSIETVNWTTFGEMESILFLFHFWNNEVNPTLTVNAEFVHQVHITFKIPRWKRSGSCWRT
jgi:hypothetical protein